MLDTLFALMQAETERLAKEDDRLVTCKFCHQEELATLAHLHDGEWVCSECWDERLRTTE